MRYQQWWSGSFLFLVVQMGQYLVDDDLIFDASDDLYGAATAGAGFHVDIEHALEALRPGHRGVTFDGRFGLTIVVASRAFAATCGSDLGTPVMIGSQHTVVANQVDAGPWYQGGEACDKVNRLEHDLGGAIAIRCLERVDNLAV